MNSTPPPCTVAKAHLSLSPSPSIPLLTCHATNYRLCPPLPRCCRPPAPQLEHAPPGPSPSLLRVAHKDRPPPSSSPIGHKTSHPSPLCNLSLPRHLLPRSHARDTPLLLPLLPVPTRALELAMRGQRSRRPPLLGEHWHLCPPRRLGPSKPTTPSPSAVGAYQRHRGSPELPHCLGTPLIRRTSTPHRRQPSPIILHLLEIAWRTPRTPLVLTMSESEHLVARAADRRLAATGALRTVTARYARAAPVHCVP
jgi:hypothetical protein